MKKKSMRVLVLFTVGITVLILLFRYVGGEETINLLKNVKFSYLVTGFFIEMILFVLWGYRWKILLEAAKEKISIKNLYLSLFIGILFNNVTPSSKSGGEPVRAYVLAKMEDITSERAFATITTDRIFDSFPYVFLSLFSIIYLFFFKHIPLWVEYVLIIALLFSVFLLAITIYLCINPRATKRLILGAINFFGRFFPKIKRYREKAEEMIMIFNKTILEIGRNKIALIKAMTISFFMLFCSFFRVYFVFLSVGYRVDMIVPVIVTIIAILVSIIPLLPGGLGTTEGVMLLIFSIFGVSAAVSASVTILDRFFSYWLGIFIGSACFFYSSRVTKKSSNNRNL